MNNINLNGNLSKIARVIAYFVEQGAITEEVASVTIKRIANDLGQDPIILW